MTRPIVERPILFTGDMVLALANNQKHQTRRIISPEWIGCLDLEDEDDRAQALRNCPYGQPGDGLWVRERMRVVRRWPSRGPAKSIRVRYATDGRESPTLPYPERLQADPIVGKCLPYGGYREASRYDLELTSHAIERVQDITTDGIIAEGIRTTMRGHDAVCHLRDRWVALWNSINGNRAPIESNPWVWVLGLRFVRDRHERV